MTEAAAPEARRPWRSGWVAFALIAIPWFGYGGPLGMVIPAAAAALALAPWALHERRLGLEVWTLVALVAWASVSMAWSPAAPSGPVRDYAGFEQLTVVKLWLQLLLWTALVLGVRRVSAQGAERALALALPFVAAWCVVLMLDGLSGGRVWVGISSLFGVETPRRLWAKKAAEGAYVLAVVIWPFAAWAARRRGWPAAGVMIGAAAIGMAGLSAWSGFLALIAGGAALLLVRRFGSGGGRTLGVAMACVTVVTPLFVFAAEASGLSRAVQDHLTASWAARLDIWRFVAALLGEHAFRGWGLDASRTLGSAIPLHPHNGSLQLWLELGALGALLGALFWMLLGRRVARLTDAQPEAAQIAAASLAAYYVVGALSFGLWQEWWLASGALAAVACTAYARIRPPQAEALSEIGPERLVAV